MKQKAIISMFVTICFATCAFGQLLFFDPNMSPPAGAVNVSIYPDNDLVQIPPRFYGVNVHAGGADIHFLNPQVIKALNLDMFRVQVNRRTWWTGGVRYDEFLSPEEGIWNWEMLDGLINAGRAAGGEPYLALGYGSPPWINGGSTNFPYRPAPGAEILEFAVYMGDIVERLNIETNFNVEWFSIENEPENVKYNAEDYVDLATNASSYIQAISSGAQVTGPVTGYTVWEQPNGTNLYFGEGIQRIHDLGATGATTFNAVDWHIYTASPNTLTNTIAIVKNVYGSQIPLIISELNLDWECSEESAATNTSWESVLWFSRVYDLIQEAGVDKAFYFCLGNNTFGLMDYRQTKARPNYFTLWMMTNLLGRDRVTTTSSHPAIGAIATKDKQTVFLYNLADTNIDVNIEFPDTDFNLCQYFTYTEAWYEQNNAITNDSIKLPVLQSCTNASQITTPAHSIAVVTYKKPSVLSYEGFDYTGTNLDGQNGGCGWSAIWSDPESDLALSDDDTSLDSAAFPFTPQGGRVLDTGGGRAVNILQEPMAMSEDGNVRYFSMLMRKDSTHLESGEWLEMGLANGDNKRFTMGIGSNDKFYVEVGTPGTKGESTETALAGETYFLVGKLISGQYSQSAYLKVYGSGDSVDQSEPGAWTATDTGFTTYTLNRIDLNTGANVANGSMDELRIGATWADVAAPAAPDDLLMYDGFDYTGSDLDGQNGGRGWIGSWWCSNINLSNDGTNLESTALMMPGVGGRILDSSGGSASRYLGEPIDLDQDGGETYFSVLLRKGSISSPSSEWIDLSLDNASDTRFNVGIGSNDKFYVKIGWDASIGQSVETASANTTYLLVGKIVSGLVYDTAYLKVYEPGSSMDVSEPTTWTATDTGNTGYTLGKLSLSMGSALTGEIDEIRIGKTWESVVLRPMPIGR